MKSYEEMAQSLFARRDAWEEKRRRRRSVVKKSLTGAASLCLTAAVCLGVWYASGEQTQAATQVWKKEVRGNRIIYSAGRELREITLPLYALTWIPEGFEQVQGIAADEENRRYAYSESYYRTSGDAYFYWNVSFLGKSTASVQLSEHRTEERVKINGLEGDLYHSDYPEYGFEISELFWFDNEQGIMFQISGNLSREEIIKLAEGMVLNR